jgi:hypothetical protein
MLSSILSAFTLLVTIKICLDLLAIHPDHIDDAIPLLACGSVLSTWLLFFTF